MNGMQQQVVRANGVRCPARILFPKKRPLRCL